jgi:hypothetical protein
MVSQGEYSAATATGVVANGKHEASGMGFWAGRIGWRDLTSSVSRQLGF